MVSIALQASVGCGEHSPPKHLGGGELSPPAYGVCGLSKPSKHLGGVVSIALQASGGGEHSPQALGVCGEHSPQDWGVV